MPVSMTDKLSGHSLEDILPHRGSMLLIGEVLEVGDDYAITRSVVDDSFPLAGDRGLEALVLIELAAQTAGVCNGITRLRDQGKDSSSMGWLVGVKRARFYVDSVPFGATVETRSENRHLFDKLREVSAVLHVDGSLAAEITLQLYQA